MAYNARNMASKAGRHTHEGEAEMMPGEEVVVTKDAVFAKFKDAEITVKNDQMLPGFNQGDVTVNGAEAESLVAAFVNAITTTGSATLKNTGAKKALVAFRFAVVEKIKPKEPVAEPGK